MNTFDKFLNKTIKVLLISITCIMLIIGLLFVTPVYVHAINDTQFYNFPIYQNNPSVDIITSECLVFENQYQYYFAQSLAYPDTKCYYAVCSTGTNSYTRVFLSAENQVNLKYYNTAASQYGSINTSQVSASMAGATLDNVFYYGSIGTGSLTVLPEYIFENDDSLYQAFDEFISAGFPEGGGFTDLGSKEFDIPAGYAFYILTNGGSATLTTKFTVYNNLFTGGWSGSNQRIGISETRVPSNGYTFGENTGSIIPWSKLTTADSNILGQTYFGQFIYTNCPDNGNYLVIYNPVYAYDDDVTSNINGSIHVEITNFVGANRFALRSSLGFNGSVDSVSPNDYEEFETTGTDDYVIGNGTSLIWYEASKDSDDIDSSTGSAAPAASAPYNDTNTVPDNNTFLGNLIERIVSFLEAPISHIQNLQDAASNFMGWLANLWVWLPQSVVIVIVDALIVLIVIGVVKFLWK